jgi:hypothetical protein
MAGAGASMRPLGGPQMPAGAPTASRPRRGVYVAGQATLASREAWPKKGRGVNISNVMIFQVLCAVSARLSHVDAIPRKIIARAKPLS